MRCLADFKKPECLRALSWALLKNDFQLDVDMPLDRLIPTVPLRLNYILWLEDVLSCSAEQSAAVKGVDIGTHPLVTAKQMKIRILPSNRPLIGNANGGWERRYYRDVNLSGTHKKKNTKKRMNSAACKKTCVTAARSNHHIGWL